MVTKVAIVTAASMGIGAACARHLKKDGYELVLMSRSDEIKNVAQKLNALYLQGDVAKEQDLQTLVNMTQEKYGRIDAIVNNTGHPATGSLLEITDDQWYQGLDLMFLNVVRMSRLVTPTMIKQGQGHFVNISTCFANEPSPKYPISSSFRAALANFTKLYSNKYAQHGIRMNNLLPGPTTKEAKSIDDIPIKRSATFDEIAAITSFLLSQNSSFIIGQNIRADGGRTKSV